MAATAKRPPGRILTFYSYKGGTGRSMALANVAWILACNGKRVLMMDWDLEAPGLHRYFKPFLIDAELKASDGVIDLLDAYTTAATRAIDPAKPPPPDWHLEYADLTASVLSINFDLFGDGGKLDFLPAGRQTDTYALKVSLFDWKNFYTRLGGGGFVDAIRDFARTKYEYVLVDSRTGVSDTSGICSVQLPDSLVVCFTYNNQSIKGADAVARSAVKLRKKVEAERTAAQQANPSVIRASIGKAPLQDTPLPYRIFPVAMRADTGESDRLAMRQAFARQSFGDLVEHVGPSEIADYWAAVEVPYRSFYSYEEVLAPFKDDGSDPKTILAAFVRLTQYLTDHDVTEYRLPIAPALKQAYLDAYAETPQTAKAAQALRETQVESEEDVIVRIADVAMTMLPEDEKLAAWRIFGRLVRVGHDEGGGYSAIRANVSDFSEQEIALVSQFAHQGVLSISSERARARSKLRSVQTSLAPDQQTVGFRDERLVKAWKPLIDHLDADEEFLVWRQQLRGYLVDWERSQRESSAVLSGTLLAEARRWKSLRPESLNAAETEYIAAASWHDRLWPRKSAMIALTLAAVVGSLALVYRIAIRPQRASVSSEGSSTPGAMDQIHLAYQRQQQGDFTGAIAILSEGLRLEKDPAVTRQIYRDRAFCYKRAGAWEASIADLSTALATDTGFGSAMGIALLKDRGFAYLQVRDLELALADYRKLADVDPGSTGIRDALTAMLTPRDRPLPDVPYFVFTEVGVEGQNDPAKLPRPVLSLEPGFTRFLNVAFWWYRIPSPQLRYTDQRDAAQATKVADALRAGNFSVEGPILLSKAVNRIRRIELWFPRETAALKTQ